MSNRHKVLYFLGLGLILWSMIPLKLADGPPIDPTLLFISRILHGAGWWIMGFVVGQRGILFPENGLTVGSGDKD
jgi:hypothetical protein